MPGYLINQSGGETSNAFSEQNSTDLNQAYDKKFYGFRFNAQTGKLTVDEINDSIMLIRLPEPNVINANDYKTWIWSQNTLTFGWSATQKTNATMEIS